MAACKLGSKGKTLADSSYEAEVSQIRSFLQMQQRAPAPAINPSAFEITPQDYVSPRHSKKIKSKVTTPTKPIFSSIKHEFRIPINLV